MYGKPSMCQPVLSDVLVDACSVSHLIIVMMVSIIRHNTSSTNSNININDDTKTTELIITLNLMLR